MACGFLSHEEGEVTSLSDEFVNFRMVMVQTTEVKNIKAS